MSNAKTQGTTQELGELFSRSEDEIIAQWLERLQREIETDGLDTTELRDSVPDYLTGLSQVLRNGKSPRSGGREVWADVAKRHAVARVQQGFDISTLIQEFMVLRFTLMETAREAGFSDEEAFETITEFVEEAILLSVAAYVESRDEEAKSVEANHIAFLTHELRSPLGTAVLGVSQLEELVQADSAEMRLLQLVARSHKKLEKLVEGVLQVSKAEAGERTHLSQVNVGGVLRDVLANAEEVAKSKGIQIDARYDRQIKGRLDRKLLFSAVQNVLDNAVKFTKEGVVELWTQKDEGCFLIHVRDQCGGLSEEELSKMFAPYERGGHRCEPGTGLGLSIAKRAIEAQGGSIAAESIEGGCHFWMTLPYESSQPSED